MNGKRMGLATLGLSMLTGLAFAQTKDLQKGVSDRLTEERTAQAKNQALREDVEILRRLLARSVGDVYNLKHPVLLDPTNVHEGLGFPGAGSLAPSIQLEGSYLKGYGIVYSVSLPPPPTDPVASESTSGPKALSAWERTRKELRGEKVDDGSKGRKPKVSLADALLRVLAENGPNVSGLGPNENVTVAITFRGSMDCGKCHAPAGGMGGPGMIMSGMSGMGMMAPGMGSSAAGPGGGMMGPGPGEGGGMMRMMQRMRGGTGGAGSPPTGSAPGPGGLVGPGPGGGSGSSGGGAAGPGGASLIGRELRDARGNLLSDPETENNLLLGDLHLKQGHYAKAVEAYQKALDRTLDLLKEGEKTDKGRAVRFQALVTAMELYGKLGQANLGAGDAAKAREALGQAAAYARLVEKILGKEKDPDPLQETRPSVTLPAKLTITVPVKLLHATGTTKMSPEEFRKQATVEYVK